MRLKIATYIDVPVSADANIDEAYLAIEADILKNRDSYEFVIEEVDGDLDHELVDEVVP